MTLTTGPVPVTAAVSVALPQERFARTVPARRTTVLALVVLLDVLAAAAAAALVHGVLRIWVPAMSVGVVVAWPLALVLCGGYARSATDPHAIPGRALLRASGTLAVAFWVVLAVAPDAASASTQRLAVGTLLLATAMPVLTVLSRSILALAAPSRPVPALVVGHGEGVRALLHEADRSASRAAFRPVAVCLPEPTDDHDLEQLAEAWSVPVLMGIEDQLLVAVETHGAQAVVAVPGPHVGHAELRRWGVWLQDLGVDLLVSPGLRDVARGRLGFTTLGGADLVHVRPARLSGFGLRLKGVVDRVAAAALLALLSPVLGVLTLLIRADSPGSGFYRQTRVGRHGRLFTVYKLRTMRTDADRAVELLADANESDRDGVLFKIKRDPRITRIGSVLRAYSLDELPQLVNVVRGEMSLVGPRPALPSEVRAYHADVVHRLAVKPGMTGLWQVSGRSDLSWDETVRLDLQYVDNWSWWLDVRIALRTATAVVGRRGAY
jgi:exopolysaccharide biosynthesis polyprenyl glycosylphosphotransferase